MGLILDQIFPQGLGQLDTASLISSTTLGQPSPTGQDLNPASTTSVWQTTPQQSQILLFPGLPLLWPVAIITFYSHSGSCCFPGRIVSPGYTYEYVSFGDCRRPFGLQCMSYLMPLFSWPRHSSWLLLSLPTFTQAVTSFRDTFVFPLHMHSTSVRCVHC